MTLPVGSHAIKVAFTNDYLDSATSADRNLWIDYVDVIGPIGATVSDYRASARTVIVTLHPASSGAALRPPDPGRVHAPGLAAAAHR